MSIGLFTAIIACSPQTAAVKHATSFEEARQLAAADDALVLVDFWRDG
jgi:hypothetical protein